VRVGGASGVDVRLGVAVGVPGTAVRVSRGLNTGVAISVGVGTGVETA
jgi:hypothetical protein